MFCVGFILILVAGIHATPMQRSNKYSYNVVANPTRAQKSSNSVYQPSFYYKPSYEETLKPYEYSYLVKDDYSGNDFEASESSDGKIVQGYYAVLLPDGRRQRVEYTADHENGYNADVTYEGSASTYHISKFNNSPKNNAPSTPAKPASTKTPTYVRPTPIYTPTTKAPVPKAKTKEIKANNTPTRYVTYGKPADQISEPESNEVKINDLPEKNKAPTRRYGYTILNRNSRYSNYPPIYHSRV